MILEALKDPNSYPSAHKEFFWLQRLIAWLSLGKKPPELEKALMDHYKFGWFDWFERMPGRSSSDFYLIIGRYLLDLVPQGEVLGQIRSPKQRCETS